MPQALRPFGKNCERVAKSSETKCVCVFVRGWKDREETGAVRWIRADKGERRQEQEFGLSFPREKSLGSQPVQLCGTKSTRIVKLCSLTSASRQRAQLPSRRRRRRFFGRASARRWATLRVTPYRDVCTSESIPVRYR